MYKKELEYVFIEYSDKDLDYIDELCLYFEQSFNEIVGFFNIKEFGQKVNITLWDNLEGFRNFYKKSCFPSYENKEMEKWICGFANAQANTIHTLCLEEYRKTEGHENSTLQDLKQLLAHEFTHSCHYKLNYFECKWLSEGLATTLSHQLDNANRTFNFTLDEVINGGRNYINYHTMFNYAYETYGREYILELIVDNELLETETPRLYEETKTLYGPDPNGEIDCMPKSSTLKGTSKK